MAQSFMKLRAQGFGQLETRLEKLFRRELMPPIKSAVLRTAHDVAFVASEMAPRATASLETAIEVKDARHDYGWMKKAEIWINKSAKNEDANIKVVEYASEAHNLITPKGSRNLGERSEEKEANNGFEVGGGFFERAVEFSKEDLHDAIYLALRQTLQTL